MKYINVLLKHKRLNHLIKSKIIYFHINKIKIKLKKNVSRETFFCLIFKLSNHVTD